MQTAFHSHLRVDAARSWTLGLFPFPLNHTQSRVFSPTPCILYRASLGAACSPPFACPPALAFLCAREAGRPAPGRRGQAGLALTALFPNALQPGGRGKDERRLRGLAPDRFIIFTVTRTVSPVQSNLRAESVPGYVLQMKMKLSTGFWRETLCSVAYYFLAHCWVPPD